MKAFVITITDNKRSIDAATSCIISAQKYRLNVMTHPAVTPRDPDFIAKVAEKKIRTNAFTDEYSRPNNAIAAFLSHMSLWEKCVELGVPVVIFEHDAIMTSQLPNSMSFDGCLTFGKPSYGKFNTPNFGITKLSQKPYFGGAHAYIVNPRGAQMLLDKVASHSQPADIFLNRETFPFLQELYPWCAEVKDSFTTIQSVNGCRAKHNWDTNFEIIPS